ncbi:hypothetical protein FH972_025246 [Carpinus fangiana]|uniref:Uncharacterized protein n=1 Tax=Carpinus fangiana TaxID=176857 RepID=A0A5N6L0L4_9ROSI|nr:hypothetical protein FH972_025246 [Carpinus fangiana]
MPSKSKARSRNSTPMSTGSHDIAVPSSAASQPSTLNYDEILDAYCKGNKPPASATLKKIADALRICSEVAQANVDKCDRGMRDTKRRRESLADQVRDLERDAEEAARANERIAQEHTKEESDEERPLAVGAHALAPQDGSETKEQPMDIELPHQPPEQYATSPARSDASSASPAPPAKPAAPREQTFGPDPSTFDDPTVYDIREVTDDLSEEEKLAIFGVTNYPYSDLHDLTCGTPPDRDFSNSKPPNQISANTFLTAIEPFMRPLGPEDQAFLEERGDRVMPFEMPRKGVKSYKEIWAQEDGTTYTEKQQNNTLDQDDAGESGDLPTAGPMLSRLLATMRPERRLPTGEALNGINGDNGGSVEPREQTTEPMNPDESASQMLPASFIQDPFHPPPPGWKNSTPRLDMHATDERVKQELRYIGFLSDDAEPDYDAHYDDEVAARLRYLQEELEQVAMRNGARKSRVAELAEERMAKQEWSQISDDLDTQLNQGYLKRHRNSSKGKKNLKRAGGVGGGSHPIPNGSSKPGLGEPIRNLMERRSQWNTMLGPVVDYGKTEIPKATIFDKESMDRHMAREKESWAEAQDQSG